MIYDHKLRIHQRYKNLLHFSAQYISLFALVDQSRMSLSKYSNFPKHPNLHVLKVNWIHVWFEKSLLLKKCLIDDIFQRSLFITWARICVALLCFCIVWAISRTVISSILRSRAIAFTSSGMGIISSFASHRTIKRPCFPLSPSTMY